MCCRPNYPPPVLSHRTAPPSLKSSATPYRIPRELESRPDTGGSFVLRHGCQADGLQGEMAASCPPSASVARSPLRYQRLFRGVGPLFLFCQPRLFLLAFEWRACFSLHRTHKHTRSRFKMRSICLGVLWIRDRSAYFPRGLRLRLCVEGVWMTPRDVNTYKLKRRELHKLYNLKHREPACRPILGQLQPRAPIPNTSRRTFMLQRRPRS